MVTVLAACKNQAVIQLLDVNFKQYGIEFMYHCVLPAAFDMYCKLKPDIMLMEINWPPHIYTDGVYSVIAKLIRVLPKANIIAMTTYYDELTKSFVKDAGVKGYVYLEAPHMNSREILNHFRDTIQKVAETGQSYFIHYPVKVKAINP